MRNVYVGLLSMAMLLSGFSAEAISLRFKFKVFSSGPNIYACNAGIMAPPINKKVCYYEGTTNACTPTTCGTTGEICDTRCICTGNEGGEYLMNYGKVSYEDWKDNGDTSVTGQVVGKTFASTGNDWAQPYPDSESFNRRIKDLSFNLGSELYGARYFVDICYRGPQIEYFEDGVKANFSLLAEANATDFFQTGPNGGDNNRDGLVIPGTVDGKKYTELAGLTVQAFAACDLQGVGALQYARNNAGQYNT
ncbi:MAG: protease, partial [Bdellovibrionaceae bacterium]|nr:protease [Pseudobdellovibrionaceae bacterium]